MSQPCCEEVGPLLTAPGTSGRSWQCDTCGRVWKPMETPTTRALAERADGRTT